MDEDVIIEPKEKERELQKKKQAEEKEKEELTYESAAPDDDVELTRESVEALAIWARLQIHMKLGEAVMAMPDGRIKVSLDDGQTWDMSPSNLQKVRTSKTHPTLHTSGSIC